MRPPAPLRAVRPSKAHRFPHRRITIKVCRAELRYVCEVQGPAPPDHSPLIEAGTLYVRVAIRPARRSPDRWRSVRLCPGCAIHLGLAVR